MARRILSTIVLVLLLTGCAVDPTTRWAQSRGDLTTAQRLVLDAHRLGQISDHTLVEKDHMVQSARRALEIAETNSPGAASASTKCCGSSTRFSNASSNFTFRR